MPKARASTGKALHFQVQPWQTKAKHEEDGCHEVQYADLIKLARPPEAAADPEPQAKRKGRLESAVTSAAETPWISKSSKSAVHADADAHTSAEKKPNGHLASQSDVLATRSPTQQACSSGSVSQGTTEEHEAGEAATGATERQDAEAAADIDNDDDGFDLEPSTSGRPVTKFDGTCHLALLPSGHMSGHVIQHHTRRSLGIMARCVTSPSAAPGCMEDEDMDVLKMRLLNFQTNQEVEAVVSRSGGDMARVQPAEAWQLRKHLGVHDTAKAEEMLELQVSFSAEQLLEGAQADCFLQKYNPRLIGRNAVINSGALQVTGLPSGFLAFS